MFRQIVLLLLIPVISLGQSTNIIALRNGARLVSTPPSYKEMTERNLFLKYSPGALFDETNDMWCSKNARFPFIFVVELAEEYSISKLTFDNKCEDYSGIETKNIQIEFSTTSPTSGYQKIADYTLEKSRTNTFGINPERARWIRLTILSNYGHSSWVELAEFGAIGVPAKEIDQTININGAWNTNWQNIEFVQSGSSFTGSYAYDNVQGVVKNGKIKRNVIEFDWKENHLVGKAKLYLNEEGNRLSGIWQNSRRPDDFGLWTMKRDKARPIVYQEEVQELEVPKNDTAKEVVEYNGESVAIGENIIMDNVLFVRSKAELLNESYSELDRLIGILNENPDLKVELSGHTDNSGSAKLNVRLSKDRVEAVKKYLISKGIDDVRISGEGYGPYQPITENRTENERQKNRRVEFKLVK